MRMLLLLCFSVFAFNVLSQPLIKTFSPASGPVGTLVTIQGANFSTTSGNNIVFFGAVKASVVSASINTLTVTVPVGATYHPITVTVNNLTAYSLKPFNITFPGCISNLATSFNKVVQPGENFAYGIIISDLDGDGKPDLSMSSGGLTLTRNTSTPGNISFNYAASFPNVGNAFFNDVGDLDGDGKPDIAVADGEGGAPGSISVLINKSVPGTINFQAPFYLIAGAQPSGVRIRDLDGDGKPDVVVTNTGPNTLSIFKNTSTPGNISFTALPQIPTGDEPYNIWIDDLDGDGKPDLVVPNLHSNDISIYRNTSTAGIISFQPYYDLSVGGNAPFYNGPTYVSCADLDGDGKDEIIVSDIRSQSAMVYGNNSSPGNFSFQDPLTIGSGVFPSTNCVTDINGDGKPDILITYIYDGKVGVVQNNSTPGNFSFSPQVDFFTGYNADGLDVGDLDNDGKPDFVVPFNTTTNASIITFRNLISLPPVLNIASLPATCNSKNGSISVITTGGTPPFQYNINAGAFQTSATFPGLDSGIYLVTVKDSHQCSASQIVTIKQTGIPSLFVSSVDASCTANDGSITVTASGGISPYLFSKDRIVFQSSGLFNDLGARSYTIVVQDSAGCTADTIIKLINKCITFTTVSTADSCNKNTGSIRISASGGIPPYGYAINGNNFQSYNVFGALPSGTYSVVIKDAAGAKDSVAVTIDKAGSPVMVNAGKDVSVCIGDSVMLVGNTNGTSFSWSPAGLLDNSSAINPVAFPSASTTFILSASNGICSSSDSINISVDPTPFADAGNDTVASINVPVQLHATSDIINGASSYNWQPSAGLNNAYISDPVATLFADITYKVTITNSFGCKGSDTISIKVFKGPEIYVPNAFSPNGDGLNDTFKATAIGIKKFTKLSIYNRWGTIIFSSTNQNFGWDGSIKNNPQPAGIYVWIAEGVLSNGAIIKRKGVVMLVR